jgi:hypothetical protein
MSTMEVPLEVVEVRGRRFVILRSDWDGKAGGPSYDVRDEKTDLCLTPNPLREQPDAARVAELLDELAALFAAGETSELWNHDDHYAIEEVVAATRIPVTTGFWTGDRGYGRDTDNRVHVMIGFGRHRSYFRIEGPELVETSAETLFGVPSWDDAGAVDIGRDPGSEDESRATVALLHAVAAHVRALTGTT